MKYVDAELAQRVTSSWEDIGGVHHAWDVIASGGFAPGINVGFDDAGVYFTDFRSHYLGVGDTGSGKTCSLIETTDLFLAITDSKKNCLIGDSKGGVARDLVPLFKSRGYEVIHVNPRSSRSARFNPLLAVWKAFTRGDKALAEERLSAVIDPLKASVHSTKDAMWEDAFENLVSGGVMAKMDVEPHIEPTLSDIVDLCAGGADGIEMLASRTRDEVASTRLRAAISCKEAKSTMGGILIVTQTALKFWSTNVGRNLAGRGGVDIERTLSSERPSAIFITYPDEAVSTRVLVSIFFDQYESIYTHNYEIRLDEGAAPGRGARMVIDEWGMLPRVTCMPRLLATARSRDLYVAASCQSISQMLANYTEAETVSMLGQFGTLVVFRNCDGSIAREAALRTGGIVGVDDFAALQPGRAIILTKGKPALASQLPSSKWLIEESPLRETLGIDGISAGPGDIAAAECSDITERIASSVGVGLYGDTRGDEPRDELKIEHLEDLFGDPDEALPPCALDSLDEELLTIAQAAEGFSEDVPELISVIYKRDFDSDYPVIRDKSEWSWAVFERGVDQIQDGEYAAGLESIHEACLASPGLKDLNGALYAQGMAHFGLGNARESARYLLRYAKSPLAEQHVNRDEAAFAMIELGRRFADGDATLARELLEAAVGLDPSLLECRAEAALALATMIVGEDAQRAQEVVSCALDDSEWDELAEYVKRVKKLRKRLKRIRGSSSNNG